MTADAWQTLAAMHGEAWAAASREAARLGLIPAPPDPPTLPPMPEGAERAALDDYANVLDEWVDEQVAAGMLPPEAAT